MDTTVELQELSDEELAAHRAEVLEAFNALIAEETPTAEQVAEAAALGDRIDAIDAVDTERQAAAEALAADIEAQRNRFPNADAEAEDQPEADAEAEVEVAPEAEVVVEAPVEVPQAAAAQTAAADESIRARASTVAVLAGKTNRPQPPATREGSGPVKIIASANTDFNAGSDLGSDLSKVNDAVRGKMSGFGAPNGDGSREDLQMHPVARFQLDFPDDLTQSRGGDDMSLLYHAADEHRLAGDSLVAANGWCAPSETLYDLCVTETTDGIGSVPEINITRGGIKFTTGPDFSAIYDAAGYFDFTEVQSLAGTGQSVNKPCVTVTCPSFTDVRLDSVGLCIKVEFLQNAAYPETTQRFIAGALVAQQHKVWIKVLGKILTAATAKTWLAAAPSPVGSVLSDSLDGLTLYKDQLIQKYKFALNSTMELLLPWWLPDVIKADISRRPIESGISAITTEQITALFRARGFNPQYVYGLPAGTATGGVDLALADVTGPPAQDSDTWPTVYTAVMYPAGSFVKGTADVVNLSAVYDAASLANNIYTGLFAEQGVLVAQLCPGAFKVQIPVCGAGRTGIANLACA